MFVHYARIKKSFTCWYRTRHVVELQHAKGVFRKSVFTWSFFRTQQVCTGRGTFRSALQTEAHNAKQCKRETRNTVGSMDLKKKTQKKTSARLWTKRNTYKFEFSASPIIKHQTNDSTVPNP